MEHSLLICQNLLTVFLHNLLIVKLHAYGVDMKSLRFLHEYLNDRKQGVKINNKYSSFEEILFGVPRGSILGYLYSLIFLTVIFF